MTLFGESENVDFPKDLILGGKTLDLKVAWCTERRLDLWSQVNQTVLTLTTWFVIFDRF